MHASNLTPEPEPRYRLTAAGRALLAPIYSLTPEGAELAEQLRVKTIVQSFHWQLTAGPSVAEVEARRQPCQNCSQQTTCADCHEEAAWRAHVHPGYVVDDLAEASIDDLPF